MNLANYFNQQQFDKYVAYLKSTNLSSSSLQRKLSSISTFQKFLIKKNIIPQIPKKPIIANVSDIIIPSKNKFLNFFKSFSLKQIPQTSKFYKYLLISSLIIIVSGIGITLYRQAITKAKKNLAYTTASTPVYANRFLSFQGRLTDSAGNPINSSTTIVFELYNTENIGTGTSLYTSATGNSQTVLPDENGIFSVTIGKTHGIEIPNSVFTQNSAVYLQITAGGEVMDPRQPIATVAYAVNSESLQGLQPSASGLKDTVLVIDGQGNLNLGETSPTIKSTSGTLGIEGQAILLTASNGSGGDIEINPDASGIIKLTTEGTGSTAVGGFIDATNANLSIGNLFNADINNTNRGYNFISFNNYDIGTTHSSTRFSIDASGNTYIGGTLSPTTISIGNTILTSSASELNLLDGLLPTSGSIIYGNGSNLSNTSVGASGQILMSNGNGSPFWVNPNTAGIGVTYDAVNGITLAGAQFKLGGALTENTRLNIGSTEVLYFSTLGNIGIGITNPTAKLSLVVPEEYVIGSTSYSIGESQTSSSTFSVAGIGQSWQGDENKYEYTLPFTFPFFGVGITNFQVSTNGYIWVDPTNNNDPDYNPTSSGFSTYSAIAPLWGDLVTDGSGQANEDIYIDESISNQVTITWVGEIYGSSSNVVNFSVTLHSNGTIEYKYGSGNTNLEENGPESGLVFVGDGKGHYQELSISGASNQTNTNDVFVTINENVTQGIAKSTIFSIGSTGNNYLTLNNDGHLGLGTTNPLYILDVADDVNFRTNVNIGGTATFGNDLNLNNNYITNGTQPGGSNFIGYQAGNSANSASRSNFLGEMAGLLATNAYQSNFLGLYAGYLASNANNSNFFGVNAGMNAVNANNSNFFGYQSAWDATNASNSNFFGYRAGMYGVGASYSNFFGYQAGIGASNATNSNFFGNSAGQNAANAYQSNFFGYQAGLGASYAYNSNFFGRDAGIGASRASNSNFIGYQAGKDAINATNANFFGSGAGVGASGAWNSNFFGLNAGIGASDAYQSNFFGGSAGSRATDANDSNFFGSNAGRDATNASMSNFFSQGAGIGASNAHDSNFFGFNAGIGASNAYHSNFLGFTAGKDATNAYYSNFFGYQAGLGGTSASFSNFLGLSAGLGATNAANSNFLGQYSGRNAINASNSNFSGYYAGYYAMNASYSNFFGQNAGRQAYNASYSNFFGVNAGYGATNANTSNFFGQDAGYLATGANNSNFLGRASGYNATNASNSNFLGFYAGFGATNAANSIFIGTYAGYNDTVNTGSTASAIAIGRYAGTGGFKNSIAIGQGVINTAEQQANIGNVLYLSGIYNSDTQSGAALATGKVGIGTTNPQSKLSVIGSISGDNLVLAGNNQLSGFSGFNSFLNSSNGLGTNGLIRLTTEGNLSNIGSIQAGQLNITSGGTFGVATTYPAGTNPDDLIVDDFNSDGITDLAVIYNNTGFILFTNDGSGNLGVGLSYPASYSDEIASGDLNGDGLIDIVTSNGNGFNVFLNQGQGIFDTGTTYPYSPLLNGGTIIADINEDGKPDLILSNSGTDKFAVFKNQGNGTFGVGSTYSSNTICDEPSTPSVADYNGDSKKDISMACYAGSRFAVFLNQGNGSFSVGVTYPTAASYGSKIASADFDGDGKPDVVVDHGPSETISIFKNQGNGTFDTGTTYPIKDTSHFMTTTDFTGDGKPDIALSDHYRYTIETFINSGNGNLDVGPTYPKSGNGLGPIDFGDFNHDGKNDIIAVNRTSGSVAIYLNNSTPTLFTNTTGNVGIGTTNPTKKLDVVGDIKLTGQLFVGTGFTGAAGQVLVSTGVGLSWATASGSGPTYTASTGITLVGSDIQLNLGYTPTWTGLHTFNGGIGVSGSASFGSDIDLNNFYITNGTQPGNSNFIGSYAGYNATNSHDSNFFGQNSGNSASGAYQSNFFGSSAGDNAFNAHDSNFFGYYAGVGASNAHNSNFFGQSAGVGASNAYRSNFFGQNAGQNAFNTQYSNFFGYNAGQYAYNANNSNFFGQSAGVGASNAYISNFFGPAAGQNATFAWGSNFFGYSVGIGASNANLSNFFGYEAGVGASAAYSSNFFGQYAGKYATGGYRANYFGESAGQSATNASYSNFFGYSAGVGASSATGSNFIGTNAGQNATTARYSNFFGNDAGRYATNANFSNFIGIDAGIGASNASSAIFIGSGAGYNDTVNTVSNGTAIAIGDYSGTGGYKNSIAIGHGVINTAEEQANIGNVLYLSGIYNSDTQSGAAVANGKVGIGTTNPQYKLDVAGDGRFSTNLNIGGTLTISQGAQDGYVLTSDASGHTYWGVGSTASGVNYTASNGLTLASNTFKLGGALTENTNLTIGNTSALFINSTSGNVGIGTTSPIAKLHIFNSSDNSELLRFDATSGRYTSIQNYLPNGSYDNAGTQFYKNSTWGEFKFSNLNGDLLTINKVGNVGIGTTNPTSKLQVAGNIELGDGTTTQSLYAYNSDRSYNGQLELYNLATGNVTLKTSFDSGNIILMPGTTGKVGIGTTNPTYKLDVAGDGRFSTNLNVGGTLTLSQGAGNNYLLKSDASGNASWVDSSTLGLGTTYAAGSGLTLSSDTFSLNLGSTNVWLAPQIFTNGIGVTGTAVFSNDINLSNNYITNGIQPGGSNFIGYQAGLGASNATYSNFIGYQAGLGASYAHDSNFIGYQAGIGASNSYWSNFLGKSAGKNARDASYSNFFGYQAGLGASNATFSNFLGYNAGYGAEGADNSNFFGWDAGENAKEASYSNFFGYNAGYYASNAHDSNFFGQNAGTGASGANNSNFFGNSAGIGASQAYYSNFFGKNAGQGANTANNSNFFGQNAGIGASSASNSNFFGNNAGQNANTAYWSNFIGLNAGQYATNAYNSNFFGQYAGIGASNATDSNFFGYHAGQNARNSSNSNFFGNNAGIGTSVASNSNFFGSSAGIGASSASNSNFFGSNAGQNAANATNSNFFGQSSGIGASAASQSNFIGWASGIGASTAYNSNFLGQNAGSNAINAYRSNFFGQNAGQNANYAFYSNFIGYYAGVGASNAPYSNFFGYNAGIGASNANRSNFFGTSAGQGSINASYSNFLGYNAGTGATNAANSIFIGSYAGLNDTVNTGSTATAIAIGRYAGTGGFKNSIAIGRGVINTAEQQANIGNVLYLSSIYNSDTQSGAALTAGKVGIGTTNPTKTLTVAGDEYLTGQLFVGTGFTGSTGQVLVSTGVGLSWATVSGGPTYTASTGITLVASDIQLNLAYTPTWTGLHTFNGGIDVGGTASFNSLIDLNNNYLTNGTQPGDSNFVGYYAGLRATSASYSNFFGINAGVDAVNASSSNFFGYQAGLGASDATGSNFFGYTAGKYASNASNSNFFGYEAGLGASNAYNSNFFGQSAGVGASIAYRSNFFGQSAGQYAFNAQYSNFFGYNAGQYAYNATNSNFFGQNAGVGASTAYSSNFFGQSAGIGASSARFSNFLGSYAGQMANKAEYSNFIGVNAGQYAYNASNSNFIGSNAGVGASNANQSNFIGPSAGIGASSANQSNFIGSSAGKNATNAANSNFFGYNTGVGASNANQSNFFGYEAGLGASAAYGSNFFGQYAGRYATGGYRSNYFGEGAGHYATNAWASNFFGYSAGIGASSAANSNFIGSNAGENASSAQGSNFIGYRAGQYATSAQDSNFIGLYAGRYASSASTSNFFGYSAGMGATNADNSIFIGSYAGYNDTVNTGSTASAIAIGRYAGTGGFKNSIAIGRGVINTAEQQANIGNVLYLSGIYNSDTQSGAAIAGGKVGIGTTNPSYTLDVAGDINITGSYRINGTPIATGGSSQWTTIGSNIYYNAGAVGIGTTTPSGKLTVAGSSGDSRSVSIDNQEIKFRGDGVAHMSIFGPDTGKSYITFQNTSANSATGTAGTDLLTILSDGKVGIGTIAPSQRFQVTTSGANDVQYGIRLQNPNNSTTGASIGIAFANDTDANLAKGALVYTGREGYGKGDFLFLQNTNNDLSVPTLSNAVMAITNAGNVGIGTTAPNYKLDVAGDANITSNLNIGGTATFGNDINLNNFYITNGQQPGGSNFIGDLSGVGATSASNSNFLGYIAGLDAAGAHDSNFLGQGAGGMATNASFSNFFGSYAGMYATDANNSNFFGNFSGVGASDAMNSNFFGLSSGYLATNAGYSNFFGFQAGSDATNALSSNFIGTSAGLGATNAANAIFIGSGAGYADTVDTYTNNDTAIAIGQFAGTGGFKNSIAIGRGVVNTAEQQANIGNVLYLSGIYNSDAQSGAAVANGRVGIGTTNPTQKLDVAGKVALNGIQVLYRPADMYNSLIVGDGGNNLSHTSGDQGYYNTFVGLSSGISNTTGSYNTALGSNSLYNNTQGYDNTASGGWSLFSNVTGYENAAFGSYSLYHNIDGDENTALGVNALFANTTGNNNIGIGYLAGRYLADGSTGNSSPDYSMYLGYDTKSLYNNAQNEIVIGYNAISNGSNSVVLGNDSITNTILKGNVGIGTTNPLYKLEVNGAVSFGGDIDLNNFFITNGIQPGGSNFIGYQSGLGATNAYSSNFLGYQAGLNANDANNSNFLGYQAGIGASWTSSANYFGQNAGQNAANAIGSNFFGQYAGFYADSAMYSNFFGSNAGENAAYADSSNFFGQNAGKDATYAMGSNFFGSNAGTGASDAANSNFFGYYAGRNAASASFSNFFGHYAGNGATNAANAIFIGSYAGYYDTVDTTSSATAIAIGRYAGTGGYKNSIAIGRGVINTAEQQANIGNVLYLSGIYNSDTQSGAAVAGGKVSIGNTNPTGIFQVDVGTSQAFFIAANGNVGLGTTAPSRQFTVIGNGSVNGVALFQNTNTGKTMPTMIVQTGSSGTGFTGTYINFVNGAGTRMGRIRNTGTGTLIYGTTINADFAEYVHGDEPTEPTDLVAYHGDKFGKAVDGQMVAGTHTNYGTFLGNEAIADEQYAFPLAMIGIVDVKISSIYGDISPGDPIATSPFAGVAAKSTKAGRIVGRAISSYSNNDPNAIGTIKIIVNAGFYDPDVDLTSTGQIAVNYNVSESVLSSLGYSGAKNEIESATYNLTDSTGSIVAKVSQFQEIAAAKIKAGFISVKNIIADNIVTKNLISQKITTDNIVSPLGNIDHLTTQDIQSTNVETENLVAQNIQTTQVSTQNLETDNLTADDATISGTLYADNIISREGSFGDLMTNKISSLREELQKLVAKNEATPSALLAESESWYSDIASDSATIHGDLNLSDNLIVGNQLIVNGNAQLGNTFINGIFNVGDIAIKDNLIETTNTALYIQPSQTGSVHIMGDTLVIADNGSVTINGNLSVTGSFAAGNIIAEEITTNKLTANESILNDLSSTKINIATDSASTIIASESDIDIATSSAKVNSNATAGTATLPAGKTELIISTNKITPESMVYLTPLASTQNQVLYVKSKDTSSFTISLDNPLTNDIQINWWIIN